MPDHHGGCGCGRRPVGSASFWAAWAIPAPHPVLDGCERTFPGGLGYQDCDRPEAVTWPSWPLTATVIVPDQALAGGVLPACPRGVALNETVKVYGP